jgi:hypothetical protein
MTASSKYQTVDPLLLTGMMLPSNTKTGLPERSSGRQNPLAGQCEPVLAISPRLAPEVLLVVLIFFIAGSPLIGCEMLPQFLGLLPILESGALCY